MTCPHCRNTLPDGLQVCFHCGKPVQPAPPRRTEMPVQPRYSPARRQGGGKLIAGVAATLVVVLGVAAGGHFMGFYESPLLPEMESSSGYDKEQAKPESKDAADADAEPKSEAGAQRESGSYQRDIDVLLSDEYYLIYHDLRNENTTTFAFDGESLYQKVENARGTTMFLMTGEDGYMLDPAAKTYAYFQNSGEGAIKNIWDALSPTGKEGTYDFNGETLDYVEYSYSRSADTEKTQFFYNESNVVGVRFHSVNNLFGPIDIVVDEISTDIPDGVFEIPSDYEEVENPYAALMR